MAPSLVQEKVTTALTHAVEQAKEQGSISLSQAPQIHVDFPKREEWGDFCTNVAMTIAKTEGRPPKEIAELIARYLHQASAVVERVDVAPPGFLNLTIAKEIWLSVLADIERQGSAYGRSNIGEGRRILVEFVSANPTGPLHLGHGRGAALGDSLARILSAAGYRVEREFYINDAGRQMKLLAASVWARYKERHGLPGDFPEDGYHGDYIVTIAQHITDRLGKSLLDLPEEEAGRRCGELAMEELLAAIREDLHNFGVDFSSWFSEAGLFSSGKVEQVLDDLKKRNLVFEKDGAWWFRSTQFQDEKDRVVVKQDGDYTYLASDIAYHYDKLHRGFDQLVNIWGADHHGYIPRMQAAIQAFGHAPDRLRVIVVQMVSLLRGGKKVEMSKRAGEFVTLQEVIDEVGRDAARFFFLMRRADTHLDFDLELAKTQSAENPVYYVQYAHARLASLFRVAASRGFAVPPVADTKLEALVQPEEFRLIKQLSHFPDLVGACASACEPHRLTFYLQELASLLHIFYFKHRVLPPMAGEPVEQDMRLAQAKTSSQPPVNGSEPPSRDVTTARLVLLRQVQTVLRNGLDLLGVSAPESM